MSLFYLRAPKTPPPGLAHTEEPIRAELFSVERLEQHGETLAVAQRVTDRPGRGGPMAARVRDNGRVLLDAYRSIAGAIREERAITPAAEWLVDNFHVVEEQIREIRDDLPRGFYRQLPKLAEGPLEGYPRVFGIAWAYVAHTDSHFDTQTLARFVQAYQRVQPLTIGELWAVAITLRIVLVENLRRAAEQIGLSRAERQRADLLADRLLGANGRAAEPAELVCKDFERSPVPAAFAVELVQRLRDQDAKVAPALHWLDRRLAAQGTTADDVVREVHQGQGAMNVTVRNVITSMRLMSAVVWADFFESVSAVDAVLRADSDFAGMDFATRDRYRHAIEKIARGSGHTEIEVAQSAINLAKGAVSEQLQRHDGASRASSRVLPDFRRSPRAGSESRISRAGPRMDSSRQQGCRNQGIRRHDRGCHVGDRRVRPGCGRRRSSRRMDPLHSRDARDNSGDGCGGRIGQSGRDDGRWPRRDSCARAS